MHNEVDALAEAAKSLLFAGAPRLKNELLCEGAYTAVLALCSRPRLDECICASRDVRQSNVHHVRLHLCTPAGQPKQVDAPSILPVDPWITVATHG
jgi:hypothetical protein